MATEPCTVSGNVADLTGTAIPAAVIVFTRDYVAGQDGSAIVPFNKSVTTDGSGGFQVDLMPGSYMAATSIDRGAISFRVFVPDEASGVFANMIDGPDTDITPAILTAALAAQTAAEAAQAAAEDARDDIVAVARTLESFGAVGDAVIAADGTLDSGTDDTSAIQDAFDWAAAGNGRKLHGGGKVYRVTSTITCEDDVYFDGEGCTFFRTSAGNMFVFEAPLSAYDLGADYSPQDPTITLTGASGLILKPSQPFVVASDAVNPFNRDEGDSASQYRCAEWVVAGEASSGNTIWLKRPLKRPRGYHPDGVDVALTLTGSITVVTGETVTQASSGATGEVVAGGSLSTIELRNTTGAFNTSNQLTGSTSGALGGNSVPTAIDDEANESLEDAYTTAFSARVLIPTLKTVNMRNCNLSYESGHGGGAASEWSGSALVVHGYKGEISQVNVNRGYDAGISLGGCYGISVDNCVIENLEDNTTAGFFGYGIEDSSIGTKVSNCTFRSLRHGVKPGPSTATAGDETYNIVRQAGSESMVVSACLGVGCSSSPFDVHAGSWNTQFIGCIAQDCERGAFGIRGVNVTIVAPVVRNCRDTAIRAFTDYQGGQTFDDYWLAGKDQDFFTSCRVIDPDIEVESFPLSWNFIKTVDPVSVVVGETLTQSTTSETATVERVLGPRLIAVSSASGTFLNGYALTGSTSGPLGTEVLEFDDVNGPISCRYATMEVSGHARVRTNGPVMLVADGEVNWDASCDFKTTTFQGAFPIVSDSSVGFITAQALDVSSGDGVFPDDTTRIRFGRGADIRADLSSVSGSSIALAKAASNTEIINFGRIYANLNSSCRVFAGGGDITTPDGGLFVYEVSGAADDTITVSSATFDASVESVDGSVYWRAATRRGDLQLMVSDFEETTIAGTGAEIPNAYIAPINDISDYIAGYLGSGAVRMRFVMQKDGSTGAATLQWDSFGSEHVAYTTPTGAGTVICEIDIIIISSTTYVTTAEWRYTPNNSSSGTQMMHRTRSVTKAGGIANEAGNMLDFDPTIASGDTLRILSKEIWATAGGAN